MNVFMLEDDVSCNGVIAWLRASGHTVRVVRTIEDAAYYLVYEKEYKNYDKFIFDASLPAATIIQFDGTEVAYNGALNGIDFMADSFLDLGINMNKVAILTAFEIMAREYLNLIYKDIQVNLISKNDNDLSRQLIEFLDF